LSGVMGICPRCHGEVVAFQIHYYSCFLASYLCISHANITSFNYRVAR
jgi:hypothetical protein